METVVQQVAQPSWGLIFEVVASAFTIAGAILLAAKHRLAPWAFVMWLAANAVWIAFALINQHWFLAIQNIVLSVTSGMGVWVWLIQPMIQKNPGLIGWSTEKTVEASSEAVVVTTA